MAASREIAAGSGVRRALVAGGVAAVLASAMLAVYGVPAGAAPRGVASAGPCAPPELPVELRAHEGEDGWTLDFELPPYAGYTDVVVGFDGRAPASIGHEHALDVMTGLPRARTWMILPPDWATPGEHRLSVRLVRRDGEADGPYTLRFDAAAERLALAKRTVQERGNELLTFSEHGDEIVWLGFTTFYGLRHSIRQVRYSVDDCSLGQRIDFARDLDAEPFAEGRRQENDLILGRPFLSLPKATTRSACAQVLFADGTMSKVLSVSRQPGGKR